MKKIHFTLFLFFATTLAAICQTIISGKVIRISDGDTITLLVDVNKQVRIRLYGIDCPEYRQDFSKAATKFTSDKCYRKNVEVEIMNIDRYGRSWIGNLTR